MATFADYLNSLSPEDRAALMDQIERRRAYYRQVAESPIGARAGQLLGGFAHGVANAGWGIAQLADAVLPGDVVSDKPLMGPGGIFRSDPSLGYGASPLYGLGSLGGLITSAMLPGATLGAAAKAGRIPAAAATLGQAVTAPDVLFSSAARAALGTSLPARMATGAAGMAATLGARTPGSFEEKGDVALHSLLPGAVLGAAFRLPLPGEGRLPYLRSQVLRQGLAGAAATPIAPAPVPITNIPVVDAAVFGGAFGALDALTTPLAAPGGAPLPGGSTGSTTPTSTSPGPTGAARLPLGYVRPVVDSASGEIINWTNARPGEGQPTFPIFEGAASPLDARLGIDSTPPRGSVDPGQRSLFADVAETTGKTVVDTTLPDGYVDTPFGPAPRTPEMVAAEEAARRVVNNDPLDPRTLFEPVEPPSTTKPLPSLAQDAPLPSSPDLEPIFTNEIRPFIERVGSPNERTRRLAAYLLDNVIGKTDGDRDPTLHALRTRTLLALRMIPRIFFRADRPLTVVFNADPTYRYAATMDPDLNILTVYPAGHTDKFPSFLQTIIHELAHAATPAGTKRLTDSQAASVFARLMPTLRREVDPDGGAVVPFKLIIPKDALKAYDDPSLGVQGSEVLGSASVYFDPDINRPLRPNEFSIGMNPQGDTRAILHALDRDGNPPPEEVAELFRDFYLRLNNLEGLNEFATFRELVGPRGRSRVALIYRELERPLSGEIIEAPVIQPALPGLGAPDIVDVPTYSHTGTLNATRIELAPIRYAQDSLDSVSFTFRPTDLHVVKRINNRDYAYTNSLEMLAELQSEAFRLGPTEFRAQYGDAGEAALALIGLNVEQAAARYAQNSDPALFNDEHFHGPGTPIVWAVVKDNYSPSAAPSRSRPPEDFIATWFGEAYEKTVNQIKGQVKGMGAADVTPEDVVSEAMTRALNRSDILYAETTYDFQRMVDEEISSYLKEVRRHNPERRVALESGVEGEDLPAGVIDVDRIAGEDWARTELETAKLERDLAAAARGDAPLPESLVDQIAESERQARLTEQRSERRKEYRHERKLANLHVGPMTTEQRDNITTHRLKVVAELFQFGSEPFDGMKRGFSDNQKRIIKAVYGYLFPANPQYPDGPRMAEEWTGTKAGLARQLGVSISLVNQTLRKLDSLEPGGLVDAKWNTGGGGATVRPGGGLLPADAIPPGVGPATAPVLPPSQSPAMQDLVRYRSSLERAVDFLTKQGRPTTEAEAELAKANRDIARLEKAESVGGAVETTTQFGADRRKQRLPSGSRAYYWATTTSAETVTNWTYERDAQGRLRLKADDIDDVLLTGEVTHWRPVAPDTLLPHKKEWTDPVTGETIGVQHGLFDVMAHVEKRAKAEAAKPAPPDTPPPVPQTAEQAAVTGATARAEQPTPGPARRPPKGPDKKKPATPRELLSVKGALSRPGLIQYAFDQGALRYGDPAVTAKTGEGKKARRVIWEGMRQDQRIHHVLAWIINEAGRINMPKDKRRLYLGAYRLLKEVGQDYPSLAGLASKRTVTDQIHLLRAAAAKGGLQLTLEPGSPGRPSHYVLTDLSGQTPTFRTREMAAVAMAVDANARRLLLAPDLTPPEFRHLKVLLDGDPPTTPPSTIDPGLPGHGPIPEPPSNLRERLVRGTFNTIREVRNSLASIAKDLGDPDLYLLPNKAIRRIARANATAEREYILQSFKLAKSHGIRPTRRMGLRLAEVEQVADRVGQTVMEQTKDLNVALVAANNARREAARQMGLSSNELAYLEAMRPMWDRLFRHIGIGFARYIPGYFANFEAQSGLPTINIEGIPHGAPSFNRALRRRGVNDSPSPLDYFEVFSSYSRQGMKFLELAVREGAAPSIPEQLESLLRRYALLASDPAAAMEVKLENLEGQPGDMLAIPRAVEPVAWVYQTARGIPDPRIARHTSTAKQLTVAARRAVGRAADAMETITRSDRNVAVRGLRRLYDDLGIKVDQRSMDHIASYFLATHSGRTFGLNAMAVVRNAATSLFFVMPRTGPRFYGDALREMSSPQGFMRWYRRAMAAGAITPSMPVEFHAERGTWLRAMDKLMTPYRAVDIWERTLAYTAAYKRAQWAANRAERHGNIDRFERESNLNLYPPAMRIRALQLAQQGKWATAASEVGFILSTQAAFDFSVANTPYAFRGVWGKVLGQYGRWSINSIEQMWNLVRFGTPVQKAEIGLFYASAAAAVYGLGQAFGVDTKDWIPFIHSSFYVGGPFYSQASEMARAASGEPFASQKWASDWENDPVNTVLGLANRNLVPGFTPIRAIASEMSLSRKERRRLGLFRNRSANEADFFRRLAGLRPLQDERRRAKFANVIERSIRPIFGPAGEVIREGVDEVTGEE